MMSEHYDQPSPSSWQKRMDLRHWFESYQVKHAAPATPNSFPKKLGSYDQIYIIQAYNYITISSFLLSNQSHIDGSRIHLIFDSALVFLDSRFNIVCFRRFVADLCKSSMTFIINKFFFGQIMEEGLQIIELSALSKEEILRRLIKIFNESEIERFTLILKQTPLRNSDSKQEFSLRIDEPTDALTTRPKSSTIDRFYRTSHFLNLKKSVTTRRDNSQDSIDDDDELPDSPKDLGAKLYRLGEYAEAAAIFEELREDFPKEHADEEYKKEYREILNGLGNCYFRLEQFDKAVTTYKLLLREFGEGREDRAKGRLYNNLGCCYGRLGYEKLSMNSYNEALKIYSRLADTDTSPLLYNIANIYFNCQMFEVSERYYEQAIAERHSRNPHDRILLFHAYSKLSLAQIEQRKCKQALENLHKALKLAEAGAGQSLQLLRQCAYVKELEGKWEQALQFYEQMHLLHEQTNRTKGFLFESVANIYLHLGKMAQHRKYIRLALDQYRKDGNQRKISELSNNWSCQRLSK